MRHLLIVAIGFRVTGVLLAVLSLAALADLTRTAIELRRTPPVDRSAPLDIGTYGLVGLLSNAARAAGHVLHAFAGILVVFLAILAIAAVVVLLLGVLFYLTGWGIGQHATWARMIAMLLSAGLAVLSGAVMVAMPRDNAPYAALPIGLSLYALWVLIWRFV